MHVSSENRVLLNVDMRPNRSLLGFAPLASEGGARGRYKGSYWGGGGGFVWVAEVDRKIISLRDGSYWVALMCLKPRQSQNPEDGA